MKRARLVLVMLANAALPACLLTNDFFAFEDVAPVVAVERPEGFPGGGFGSSLAGFESSELGGLLAVGGDPGTDAFLFQTRTSTGEILPDAEYTRACEDHTECVGRGYGYAFTWLASFAGGTDCLAMGSPLSDSVYAFCIGGNMIDSRVLADGGESFGTSLSSAPDGSEVFVGAPASPEKVYVWGDRADPIGVGLGLGGTLGEAVAAVRLDESTIRVAAGGGGEVVVFDWAGAATIVGATRTGGDGFGHALAWRGPSELAIGGDGAVHAFTGTDLADEETLACDGDCATFGDALAVGDPTDDGEDEIVVGWPGRPSGGKAGSGAVAVFDGGRGEPRILSDSTPEADAALGRAVAVVPVGDRDEIVAGASGEILWFLCSGLPGDGPEVGERCRD
jgi:hypothetical protein